MAKVINLNQYREERERKKQAARERSYWALRSAERPVRTIAELEALRREVERMKLRRSSTDDGSEAG